MWSKPIDFCATWVKIIRLSLFLRVQVWRAVNTYKVRFLLSPNIYLNLFFSQVNETPGNFNCLLKLRVAQELINALYMIK